MADRISPDISTRKQPRQARANDLIAAVLDAAVQVLRSEGAARFTTARVAVRAGVSVGSLYQYFPNKAAILFRLQADEWRRTTDLLRRILDDRSVPAAARLRTAVHAFIRSECDEALLRTALADAAPLYREAPETKAARGAGAEIFQTFVAEALPHLSQDRLPVVAGLIEMTLTQVGAGFSETPRSEAEIDALAEAMADMITAYLDRLALSPP